jgi:hypothetical protein
MVGDARLRKVLVTRRGYAAAAAAAAALALTGSQAAGSVGPSWSKNWAEQQLRKHFDSGDAVCLPIGRATREHGRATFKEFVCVLVTRDGTRYTIHLRPRTHTAWTTLSIKRHTPSPFPHSTRTRPRKSRVLKRGSAHS